MRTAFIQTLTELASRDARLMLLTGDLCYMAVEPFAEKHPGRFINVGVAEQNMVGIASGLAEAGFIPFVYSIAPFAALRPYEFIRNGPIQHRWPVRVVGVGGGFEYGTNGLSHYGIEDIGVMRAQPGIHVIAPADGAQARTALLRAWDMPGPVYLRIGKDDRTLVQGLEGRFELGQPQILSEGSDMLMIATGSIAAEAAAAAQSLASKCVSCGFAVLAHFSQETAEALADLLVRVPLVVTVEAHYISGGAGSFVAELIAERGLGSRLVRCGVKCLPEGASGSMKFHHQRHGLDAEHLVETALRALGRTP
jgi:transketolase